MTGGQVETCKSDKPGLADMQGLAVFSEQRLGAACLMALFEPEADAAV